MNVSPPSSTYRWQFNRQFTFRQAAELVEYLSELGITDCYASPLFKACPQSTHGYDICAFDQLNPNLGSAADFERFAARLKELGLSLLLDMVPNHMSAGPSNVWWWDVLEKGRASPFASWFDLDWQSQESDRCNPIAKSEREPSRLAARGNETGPAMDSRSSPLSAGGGPGRLALRTTPEPPQRGKVLLPILEDHYANVLEAGKLRLVAEESDLALSYHDQRFPLSPESRAGILDELRRDPAALERLNGKPGDPHSLDRLDDLLHQQHYRLAFWRVGPEEINYRRFFDITALVSLRMELPEVFQATHQLVFALLKAGKATGLRIDHPDGLWDPKQYFERLQEGHRRLVEPTPKPLYIVAEKILTSDEPLPADWPIHGTTGYDFLNQVNGLFIDGAARDAFDRIYQKFTGASLDFGALVYASKKHVLQSSFIRELGALTHRLKRLATDTRYGQDLTFRQLHAALTEVIAAFPVYRTYITAETSDVSGPDAEYIHQAIAAAEARNPDSDSYAFRFIEDVLLLRRHPDTPDNAAWQDRRREFVMRSQQLTSPVMAKGFEDTALYNFHRLISLNEVGGNPAAFGSSLEQFHRHNLSRAEHWPHSLLATSTHDTKRGEDVRARINVLSEIPEQWQQAVARWAKLNADKKSLVASQPAPSANDEYLLYQTLVGAWPPEQFDNADQTHRERRRLRRRVPSASNTPAETPALPVGAAPRSDGGFQLSDFRERIQAYLLKAIREAKAHTNWTSPNLAYEEATQRFIERLLTDSVPNSFLDDLRAFQRKVAFFGQFNSLSQILLKMTSPGVPDFYQGTELWDLSLVDPDNRRPVDYELRRRLLADSKARFNGADQNLRPFLHDLLQNLETGQIKQHLIWRTLEFRRRHRDLFQSGRYVPLSATGPKQEHVCAFARALGDQELIVIAPRLALRLAGGTEQPPIGADVWQDTVLPLPEGKPGDRYRDLFTLEISSVGQQAAILQLSDVLASFPVALLERC